MRKNLRKNRGRWFALRERGDQSKREIEGMEALFLEKKVLTFGKKK